MPVTLHAKHCKLRYQNPLFLNGGPGDVVVNPAWPVMSLYRKHLTPNRLYIVNGATFLYGYDTTSGCWRQKPKLWTPFSTRTEADAIADRRGAYVVALTLDREALVMVYAPPREAFLRAAQVSTVRSWVVACRHARKAGRPLPPEPGSRKKSTNPVK